MMMHMGGNIVMLVEPAASSPLLHWRTRTSQIVMISYNIVDGLRIGKFWFLFVQ